jgi:hypothetical protein
MAAKKPKVGDPVLFYGRHLAVCAVEKSPKGNMLAKVEAPKERAELEAVRDKIRAARKQQAEAEPGGSEWAKLADEITALDRSAVGQAVMTVGLRLDLLWWWDEKECWVSDGRILTTDQREAFQKIMALKKVRPEQERGALLFLESQDHPSVTKEV